MEEWKECKLGEIATITKLAGFEFTKYIKYNETGEIIALRALNLRNGRLDLTEVKHIDKSVSDALPRSKLYKGEILFTYTGNGYGDCALVDEDDKYHLAPNICKISPNKKIADSNFLFQTIRSNAFYKQVSNYIGGSSQPTIPMETIRQLKVKLPPLSTQQKIAAILSSLDDKIELNNKINTNLEQQAQALFKNWFVDFEPFGGKMPEGWKVGKLSEIADYLNGLAMQKFRPLEDEEGLPVLKIKELRQGCCDESSELCSPSKVKAEYIIHDGDVIFSWSGSLLVDIWCGGTCGLNQHLFKVTSQTYEKWFYYLWTKHHLDRFIFLAADKATTMGHIKREELDKAEVFIPDDKTYSKLTMTLSPIIDTIINNRVENRRLSEIRDNLLPELMSGNINVEDITI
ncbi:MAG: restriction endonuclease subunit S [Spirochaetaceae bacterium]|nr:restriction endonuclease subunit S [Spirochaetaceae bacterium]